MDGLRVEQVVLAVVPPLIHAARLERVAVGRARGEGGAVAHQHLLGDDSMPMPPMREAVQVKYWSMTSWRRPTASNTWAP